MTSVVTVNVAAPVGFTLYQSHHQLVPEFKEPRPLRQYHKTFSSSSVMARQNKLECLPIFVGKARSQILEWGTIRCSTRVSSGHTRKC
jgi:hypothetical protein